MDAQSAVLTMFHDPVAGMIVMVVAVLIGSVVCNRHKAKRKRTDPRVLTLSEHLETYPHNKRVTAQRSQRPERHVWWQGRRGIHGLSQVSESFDPRSLR